MELQAYCLRCGVNVTPNTGWQCRGCEAWVCLSCNHSEEVCAEPESGEPE